MFVMYALNFSLSLGYLTCFSCHFLYFNPVIKHSPFHFWNMYCFSSLSEEKKVLLVHSSLWQHFYFSLSDLQRFISWFYVVSQIERYLKSITPLTPSLLSYKLKQCKKQRDPKLNPDTSHMVASSTQNFAHSVACRSNFRRILTEYWQMFLMRIDLLPPELHPTFLFILPFAVFAESLPHFPGGWVRSFFSSP